MSNAEKVQAIRTRTMAPFGKINEALKNAEGDVERAVGLLIQAKQADATDMANRVANASIVYSYVHQNRIGAMIVLAAQTDFVTKGALFQELAKDICMHIVSNPAEPKYLNEASIAPSVIELWRAAYVAGCANKPAAIMEKIVTGKLQKDFETMCLLNQKFVKNPDLTITQLIANVSAVVGEKIELKQFVKMKPSV